MLKEQSLCYNFERQEVTMKFDKKNVVLASLVFGWISIFWNVYDQLIQSINTYSFALEPYESGWILAIDNILGLFVLPLFGHFSDRCKSRFGKRTPYIYIGTAISLIGLTLVGVFASKRLLWPYIVSLTITLFAMAAYRSAGLSLVPDFVYEPDRGRANSIANLVSVAFTAVGIVLAMVFMPLKAAKNANFMPICLAVVGSSLITVAAYAFTFSEKRVTDDFNRRFDAYKRDFPEKFESETVVVENLNEKQMQGNLFNKVFILASVFFFYIAYNALVSNFTVYSDVTLGFKMPQLPLVFVIVGALPGFIFASPVAKKIGRKYTITIGLVLMMVALLASMPFSKKDSGLELKIPLVFFFMVAGVGYGFAMANLYPFYLELSKTKNIGQNTGIFAGATTAAMVITPILAGYVIKEVGKTTGKTYVIEQIVNGVNTEVVKVGDYGVLFPYCAVALLIAIICILIVKSDYAKGGLRDRMKNYYHKKKAEKND